MFNRKKELHYLYKPVFHKNEFNEEIPKYELLKKIEMAISLNTNVNYKGNDTNVLNCDYVGYTDDTEIKVGMRVDNHYFVSFVVEMRCGCFCLLSEIDSNGKISNQRG